ncbi:MAG: DUF2934 domain-containing protein [Methylococcales bacterium]
MKIVFESLPSAYKQCINEDSYLEMVARCAYFKSEEKGFTGGCGLQDWLEAEQEVSTNCFYWLKGMS